MSNRSVLLSITSLCLGLGVTVPVVAQTPTPAPPNSAAQTVPETRPANPATQSPSVSGAQSAPAQQNGQPGPRQGASTAVEDELQLTPEQKQKIAAVVDDENKQIAAVRDDNSLSLEQKQRKVLQIRQEGTPKIKAVLTPEQLQKLAVIQQRMRDQQQGNRQSAPQNQAAPQSTPQR
jgi:Spy/CpxP family protein refolding chaperone